MKCDKCDKEIPNYPCKYCGNEYGNTFEGSFREGTGRR